jgi:hypothetical protein
MHLMMRHPNVRRHWYKWEIEGAGLPRGVLVVETDLTLDPEAPDFQTSALEVLRNLAKDVASGVGISVVHIVPVGVSNP